MTETQTSATAPPSDGIDFVFRMGLQKIADQIQVFDALDTKVGVILGFVVVSIAEILGFLILAAAEGLNSSCHFSVYTAFFFLFGLIWTVLSTIFGLRALRLRKFALGFKFAEMVRKANRTTSEIQLLFLDDILASCEFNTKELDVKQRRSELSVLFAALSLVFYSITSALLFFSLMRRG
jgi:hypothetical protein